MKKIILTLTLLAGSIAVSAQGLYLGGSLGVGTSSGSDEKKTGGTTITTDKPSEFNFNISPEIGYYFTDKMAVGLMLSFDYSSEKTKYIQNSVNAEDKYSIYAFEISPYFRYHFWTPTENLSFFGQAEVDITFGGITKETKTAGVSVKQDGSIFGFGVGISPGVSYKLSDNISMLARLGAIEYSNSTVSMDLVGGGEDKDKRNSFDFKLFTNLNFGLIFSF